MADINLRAQPLNVFGTVGDDMQIVLTVVDSAGDPIDVSGYTISAKVWRGATEVDEMTDAVSGASNNVITLSLTDTETTAIGTERGLRWSLSMTASSITEQWVGGKFELLNAGHPKASGVSAATLTYTSGDVTVTLGSISTTALDGRYLLQSDLIDEDNMASDSATKVPSQQSVKAYVDANSGGSLPTEIWIDAGLLRVSYGTDTRLGSTGLGGRYATALVCPDAATTLGEATFVVSSALGWATYDVDAWWMAIGSSPSGQIGTFRRYGTTAYGAGDTVASTATQSNVALTGFTTQWQIKEHAWAAGIPVSDNPRNIGIGRDGAGTSSTDNLTQSVALLGFWLRQAS